MSFILYSQGCYGANPRQVELRPSHWRGWLRSWVLRFLLGVMSQSNAEKTLGELFGSIGEDNNNSAQQGCIRIKVHQSAPWGEKSSNGGSYSFYSWKGTLELIAPTETLNKILLPVIKFAVSVGGVGRGWRRPLHIFSTGSFTASRGSHLKINHQVKNAQTGEITSQSLALHPTRSDIWNNTYQRWLEAVTTRWSSRITLGANNNLEAEVFSPHTCAIYTLPGPDTEPINFQQNRWDITTGVETRGDGIYLIYLETSPRNYKRNPALGGNAGAGSASCSWVTIRRVGLKNQEYETDCQETVCLFMGGKANSDNHIRASFLADLGRCKGNTHLFGVKHISN